MLNPTFSKQLLEQCDDRQYIAPASIIKETVAGNQAIDEGEELRLQTVYGEELWLKLSKLGLTEEKLKKMSILEVCGGGGFLTYHLLQRVSPRSLTINDISLSELNSSRNLLSKHFPEQEIEYKCGDLHETSFSRKFDLIIGNSFLHHFHNVPKVLEKFNSMLDIDGLFVSLHEPTPMANVVESAKISAYPIALVFPRMVNEIARARYSDSASSTDIWMFEPYYLKKAIKAAGFKFIQVASWHLLRSFYAQKCNLHLSTEKKFLSEHELLNLRKSIKVDSVLNKFLPHRFFGSISIICRK